MKNKLELRMYGFVNYQLSGIQSGIQFAHGVVEYGLKYFKDKDYQDWAQNNKTVIVLNGGTTRTVGWKEDGGTMQQHLWTLRRNKIKVATFHEPDLNRAMTAITFLVDERVFNKEKYPDYKLEVFDVLGSPGQKKRFRNYKNIIGKQNLFLREFLKQFKLA